jgi:hypothetical protein
MTGPVGFPKMLSRKEFLSSHEFWPPVLDDTRTFNVLNKVLVINV